MNRSGRCEEKEFVSIQIHDSHRCVNIASDSGRVCRPLLVVERGALRLRPSHMAELQVRAHSIVATLAAPHL